MQKPTLNFKNCSHVCAYHYEQQMDDRHYNGVQSIMRSHKGLIY